MQQRRLDGGLGKRAPPTTILAHARRRTVPCHSWLLVPVQTGLASRLFQILCKPLCARGWRCRLRGLRRHHAGDEAFCGALDLLGCVRVTVCRLLRLRDRLWLGRRCRDFFCLHRSRCCNRACHREGLEVIRTCIKFCPTSTRRFECLDLGRSGLGSSGHVAIRQLRRPSFRAGVALRPTWCITLCVRTVILFQDDSIMQIFFTCNRFSGLNTFHVSTLHPITPHGHHHLHQ